MAESYSEISHAPAQKDRAVGVSFPAAIATEAERPAVLGTTSQITTHQPTPAAALRKACSNDSVTSCLFSKPMFLKS